MSGNRLKLAALVLIAVWLLSSSAVGGVRDHPVRQTRVAETHAVAGSGFLAWVQNSRAHPDHYNVFVRTPKGRVIKVNSHRTEDGLGGIWGKTLIYHEYVAGDDSMGY